MVDRDKDEWPEGVPLPLPPDRIHFSDEAFWLRMFESGAAEMRDGVLVVSGDPEKWPFPLIDAGTITITYE